MGQSDRAAARQQWVLRMQRFARSRLTVSTFCDREQVSVAAFYHWRKKLAQQPAAPVAHAAELSRSVPIVSRGFVPVKLLQSAVIEVRLVNGVHLSLPTADLEVLRQTLLIVSQLPAKPRCETEAASC